MQNTYKRFTNVYIFIQKQKEILHQQKNVHILETKIIWIKKSLFWCKMLIEYFESHTN